MLESVSCFPFEEGSYRNEKCSSHGDSLSFLSKNMSSFPVDNLIFNSHPVNRTFPSLEGGKVDLFPFQQQLPPRNLSNMQHGLQAQGEKDSQSFCLICFPFISQTGICILGSLPGVLGTCHSSQSSSQSESFHANPVDPGLDAIQAQAC